MTIGVAEIQLACCEGVTIDEIRVICKVVSVK